MAEQLHPDSALIDAVGGPTQLAQLLGYSKESGGVQRVQNWRRRGIPAQVKLDHPKVILRARKLAEEKVGAH